MTAQPKISRRGWLAMWLQGRRRARAKALVALPVIPPAPVVTVFEVIDNGGMIDVNIAWTWDGQGWPDDGTFLIYVECDDAYSQGGGVMPLINVTVNCPGRSCSLTAIGVAEDKAYYCRAMYKKDDASSDYSATVVGNPY